MSIPTKTKMPQNVLQEDATSRQFFLPWVMCYLSRDVSFFTYSHNNWFFSIISNCSQMYVLSFTFSKIFLANVTRILKIHRHYPRSPNFSRLTCTLGLNKCHKIAILLPQECDCDTYYSTNSYLIEIFVWKSKNIIVTLKLWRVSLPLCHVLPCSK